MYFGKFEFGINCDFKKFLVTDLMTNKNILPLFLKKPYLILKHKISQFK